MSCHCDICHDASPRRFAIYCDAAGEHYVLIEPRAAACWLALKTAARTLCLLSAFNLSRLRHVGHCTLT